jgi:hypothetical protein
VQVASLQPETPRFLPAVRRFLPQAKDFYPKPEIHTRNPGIQTKSNQTKSGHTLVLKLGAAKQVVGGGHHRVQVVEPALLAPALLFCSRLFESKSI